jgi:tetratricopeptide (TPR) repeat protein
VLVDQGELAEALALGREVIALGQETGDRLAEAWGRLHTGDVLYAQGDFDEAEAHLIPAAAEFSAALLVASSVHAQALAAHCLLKQGKLDEAKAILAEEVLRVRENGVRGMFARDVWTGHAAATLAAAEQAQGSARSSALNEAKAACRALLKHAKLDIGALVPGYRMQGTYEWLCGHPDKAEKWWRKSLDLAEKLGARLEGAQTYLEIGRRAGDRAALQRAEAEFAQMGAAFELAEARRLLAADRSPEAATSADGLDVA